MKQIKTIKIGKVEFNVEAVKKMNKKDFLKQHEHFKDQIDLSDAYDKIKGK